MPASARGERLTRAEAFDLVRRTVDDARAGRRVRARERVRASRAPAARPRFREPQRSHVRAHSQGRARRRHHRSAPSRRRLRGRARRRSGVRRRAARVERAALRLPRPRRLSPRRRRRASAWAPRRSRSRAVAADVGAPPAESARRSASSERRAPRRAAPAAPAPAAGAGVAAAPAAARSAGRQAAAAKRGRGRARKPRRRRPPRSRRRSRARRSQRQRTSGREESSASTAREENRRATATNDDENAAPRARRSRFAPPLPNERSTIADTELVARELLGAVLECRTADGVASRTHRRDRGVRRRARSRVSRRGGPHGAHGAALRPAGHRVRVLHLRHVLVLQRRHARGGRAERGAGSRASSRSTGIELMRAPAPAREARRRSHQRPGKALSRARHRRASTTWRPLQRPPLVIRAGEPVPDDDVVVTPRIGITQCGRLAAALVRHGQSVRLEDAGALPQRTSSVAEELKASSMRPALRERLRSDDRAASTADRSTCRRCTGARTRSRC